MLITAPNTTGIGTDPNNHVLHVIPHVTLPLPALVLPNAAGLVPTLDLNPCRS